MWSRLSRNLHNAFFSERKWTSPLRLRSDINDYFGSQVRRKGSYENAVEGVGTDFQRPPWPPTFRLHPTHIRAYIRQKPHFFRKQENRRISSTKNCNRRIFVKICTFWKRCNTGWKLLFEASLTTYFTSPSDGYSLIYSPKTIISSTKQENRRNSSTKTLLKTL